MATRRNLGERNAANLSDLVDAALEWGDQPYETDRTWLVLDEGGSVIGEVRARMAILAVPVRVSSVAA